MRLRPPEPSTSQRCTGASSCTASTLISTRRTQRVSCHRQAGQVRGGDVSGFVCRRNLGQHRLDPDDRLVVQCRVQHLLGGEGCMLQVARAKRGFDWSIAPREPNTRRMCTSGTLTVHVVTGGVSCKRDPPTPCCTTIFYHIVPYPGLVWSIYPPARRKIKTHDAPDSVDDVDKTKFTL